MKRLTYFALAIVFFVGTAIIFDACKKDEPEETVIPPIAEFSANPTSGDAPLTVNFTDLSTNNPTSWQWDFGDGGTSNQQNPSYTYNINRACTVKLTATNSYGSGVETKSYYIVVSGGTATGTFTDPRDGQTYNTVIIGSQEWFSENLNYATGNSWCVDNEDSNCNVYGRLYTWNDAMNGEESSNNVPSGVQGICPPGWHLPSDNEWKVLEMALGTSQSVVDQTGWRGIDQGKQMKSTNGWDDNGNGTNSSGFTALPGGYRTIDGHFFDFGDGCIWWSAKESSSVYAWYRLLLDNSKKVCRDTSYKELGFSVRCVRD